MLCALNRNTHTVIGILTMVLMGIQPLNAFVRPPPKGKIDAMNNSLLFRRTLWEYVHKGAGASALITCLISMQSGLHEAKTYGARGINRLQTIVYIWYGVLALLVVLTEVLLKCMLEKPPPPKSPVAV